MSFFEGLWGLHLLRCKVNLKRRWITYASGSQKGACLSQSFLGFAVCKNCVLLFCLTFTCFLNPCWPIINPGGEWHPFSNSVNGTWKPVASALHQMWQAAISAMQSKGMQSDCASSMAEWGSKSVTCCQSRTSQTKFGCSRSIVKNINKIITETTSIIYLRRLSWSFVSKFHWN